MPAEMKEMTEARALLAKFEADMHKAEGIVHLSDALALLADVRDAGAAGQSATIASNITTPAEKFGAATTPMAPSATIRRKAAS